MTATATADSLPHAPSSTPPRRWQEPLRDFLLTGGMTLLLWPISLLLQRLPSPDHTEYVISYAAYYLAFVINDPHFAVTYLLFYENAKQRATSPAIPRLQRARYLGAGLFAPLLLLTWGASALYHHNAQAIGNMAQLMYMLVGWHYVKQGFGVLTVLSARHGGFYTPTERKVLLGHALLGWGFAWSNPALPAGEYVEHGLVYLGMARPAALEKLMLALFAASTVAMLLVLALKVRRERKLPKLVPLFGYLVSIWIWTIGSAWDPLLRYFIPALHSIQYLFFVYLLRKNRAIQNPGGGGFGVPVRTRLMLLAGSALALGFLQFHGLPWFADDAFAAAQARAGRSDSPLGLTPYMAFLTIFINVHHYFMDTVIWRRDNPETRYLIDRPPPDPLAALDAAATR